MFEGISDSTTKFLEGIRRRPNRSGSLYIPPRIAESVLEKSEKLAKTDSALYLKDRGFLRHMI
jgi:hypothetical protein